MSPIPAPGPAPEMEPVVAALLRRLDIQLRQIDPAVRIEGDPLRRVYMLGARVLAVVSLHRDLFRLQTGGRPAWEARIREPEEALEALARVLDWYWQIVSGREREAC
jgi:hypothetical protein